MKARWTPSLPRPWPLIAALAAAAALNGVEIELIGGVRILLGSFLYLPFVLLLPVPWALVASGLALAPTLATLGQPFALILGMFEAGVLAWGLKRRWSAAPVIDLAFWLLLGGPLATWMYLGVAHLPADLAALEVLVRGANQVLAVVVADFLVRHTAVGGLLRIEPMPAAKLRDVIFNYVFVLAAVPVTLVATGLALLLRANVEREDRTVLRDRTQQVARELGRFLSLHEAAINATLDIAQADTVDSTRVLESTRQAFPAFVTMLKTDPTGRIVRTSPADQETRLRGSDVSDRDYFRIPMNQKRPFVSGVFRGRGFGDDLLIAVSAPMLDAFGNFQGVIQGSLKIEEFITLLYDSDVTEDVQWVIADSSGRIIYASPETGMKTMEDLSERDLGRILLNRPGEPFVYDVIASQRSQRLRAYVTRNAEYRFLVIAQRPALAAVGSSIGIYGLMAGVIAGVLVTAALVARLSALRLSGPLERFANAAGTQAELGTVAPVAAPEGRVAREVQQIYAAFNLLAERLQGTYDSLLKHNEVLDDRVGERTRELERVRREAVEASESKTAFLALASHEIRTPLGAIITEIDGLRGRVPDPEISRRLRGIRHLGSGLLEVVNDLQDLSLIESGRYQPRSDPVDLARLCNRVIDLLNGEATYRRLALTLDSTLPKELWVATDGERLGQVLVNLVRYAIRSTTKGTVWLSVESSGADPVAVRFRVVDTGPGMSPEKSAALFEPSFPVDRVVNAGVGLSLTVSRRLIEFLGGNIEVHSAEGQGAELAFSLRLQRSAPVAGAVVPLADLVVPPQIAPPQSEPASPATSARTLIETDILVVDDTIGNIEVMKALLESRCREVVVSETAMGAIEHLRRRPFTIALVDLEMPDVDGFHVAATVRAWRGDEASRHCWLVAVSAHPSEQMRDQCLRSGFDDYVEKPVSRKLLFETLRRGLAKAAEPAVSLATS